MPIHSHRVLTCSETFAKFGMINLFLTLQISLLTVRNYR